MATRFDRGDLTVAPLPGGGFRVDARMSRVGVFPYRLADGTVRRELRHPEDVFDSASVASFRDAPVTIGHPPDLVRPENWKQFSVGHISDPHSEPPYLSSPLAVQDAEACRRIALDRSDPDVLRECSLGYTCDVDMVSGDWQGERYDARQRNIRGNHVALLGPGEGRAGPEVRLRLDSGICILSDKENPRVKTHKIDGKDYEAGSDEHLAAVDRKIGELAAKAEIERKRADAAADPKKIGEIVNRRVSLLSRARELYGKDYGTGTRKDAAAAEGGEASNDDAIILDIVAKTFPNLDASKYSHDQLMALLAAGASLAVAEEASEPEAPKDMPPPEAGPAAAFDGRNVPRGRPGLPPREPQESAEAKARRDAKEKQANRWKQTIKAS